MGGKLGTKAETLHLLEGTLQYAAVLPQYAFTVEEWKRNEESIVKQFGILSWNGRVIVRSSALNEDTMSESQAGKYESVPDVSGVSAFRRAVARVIASYDDGDGGNQVLVQPMLEKVKACGVAFTLDPNTMGNYYVINYSENGTTDAITSGKGGGGYLFYCFKSPGNADMPPKMRQLCLTLGELECFFEQDNLDIEFAVDQEEQLYILQVRSLCVKSERMDVDTQRRTLERIETKIRREQGKKPFLCGERTIYSVMTDWNPAEMIGVRPKPLALSIYREIVTDSIWAYQRDNYGYRNLRSFPLMIDFCGLPYIDVRVSFNSFVPADLDETISEKLVNYYLDRLAETPQKHDKAEFDIIFSCYTLDLPERIEVLKKYGFTEQETELITEALRRVTNHIIDYDNGLWRKDYDKLRKLEQRYGEIMDGNLEEIEKAYWLLEDCKRYGTLPFAGLARGAFIAVQLLQSMVSCGILTESDYERFMNGVNTVSTAMNTDKKALSRQAFLKKYGHLRPGTYDITSLRYDEAPDLYFDWNRQETGESGNEENIFRLSLEQMNRLKKKLEENGLCNDILKVLDYIRTVIAGREYGKFVFTRNLSSALMLIENIGEREGLTRDDCAYLNIQVIRDLYTSTEDVRERLKDSVEHGKESYKITQSITLPPVIVDGGEVWNFYYPDSEPNFITSGKVTAEVCLLENNADTQDISGKILFIPCADPGYDWIFSHHICGFVTMYGGANSHMAIRAGELGIPAAVGVGAKEYDRCKEAKTIEIDCAGKVIRIIK